MPNITVFAWTVMISAYTKCQELASAVTLFEEMIALGTRPNEFTFSSVIRSCVGLRGLNFGARVHGSVIKTGFKGISVIGSNLTDLYSKCGQLKEARELFSFIQNADTISWTMMISSLVEARKWREVLQFYSEMIQAGVTPNEFTFVKLLSASSFLGLEFGKTIHSNIIIRGIPLNVVLKTSLVDFYSRLRACRYHRNLSLGEDMANKGLALAPFDPAFYILLADLYDESGKPELAQKIRNLMSEKDLSKKQGQSPVEVQGKVHSFVSEDVSTVDKTNGIYAEIEWIKSEIERSGFAYRGIIKNASYHSAKQAAVFGLVYTSAQTPVHVVKNKILCKDCHDFISLMTRLVDKNITVRDGNRVHIFNNGECSCKGDETSFVSSYRLF